MTPPAPLGSATQAGSTAERLVSPRARDQTDTARAREQAGERRLERTSRRTSVTAAAQRPRAEIARVYEQHLQARFGAAWWT